MNPITPVEQHTVLVVDDHPLFRRGVCELFSLDPTIRVVGEAGTREEALDLAEKLSPDLIVLDLNMKGSSGVEILTTLKERDPSQRVVILTVSDSGEDFFSCIRAGADGYFLKDMERICCAARLQRLRRRCRSLIAKKTCCRVLLAE